MSFLERISDDGWQVVTDSETETETETETDLSHVEHHGLDSWPKKQKAIILNRVADLQRRYGLKVTVDARPSTTGPGAFGHRKSEHYNFAEELDALMGVRPGETTLHVNPKMQYHRADVEVEEVVIHEFGHALQGHLEQTNQLEAVAELTRPFVRAANDNTLDEIRSQISPYAAETPAEGVAEAFLQHEQGISNEWSDHVGRVIKRNYVDYLRVRPGDATIEVEIVDIPRKD